ncbi:UxaA family hydrolase [Holdemania massiliensis]|uniref:UxaA family hydrolase n=1 Tax=Holdemania massiliensis TaxID=1468449 RepID=UPI00242A7249|nr:altronate dehydratase family protein [Holdemania massiliensis]
MKKTLHIQPNDNVIVALEPLYAGETAAGITLLEDIPSGHKFACLSIAAGQPVIKYGQPIGHATVSIQPGQWVHSHNLKTSLSGTLDYQYNPVSNPIEARPGSRPVMAYRRENGTIGIRNELWVIVTVGCIGDTARNIVNTFRQRHPLDDIDGIFTFNHPFGCSQMGQDHQNTVKILQDIVTHPNAGGVLVLGLGCENNQLKPFYDSLEQINPQRVRCLNCQDVENEVQSAVELLEQIYQAMRHDRREVCDLSEFSFGLKCGGSDGYSGITANPLLGRFSDNLVRYGANIVLSEVPEMFGAEQLLMNRATDRATFDKLVAMINRFKDYFLSNHQVVYENPSPGNKAGGITTLEEKSLGCIQKAGTSQINDVLDYGERIQKKGISLVYGPGNDLVSTTTLGACGCQVVLFTTGRGTPFGGFIPTYKIATHSELAARKPHWIDFNAGILTEGVTLDEAAEQLVEDLIAVLEGKKTRNEISDLRSIAIFKQGVIC